jgi:hypothetical protein
MFPNTSPSSNHAQAVAREASHECQASRLGLFGTRESRSSRLVGLPTEMYDTIKLTDIPAPTSV